VGDTSGESWSAVIPTLKRVGVCHKHGLGNGLFTCLPQFLLPLNSNAQKPEREREREGGKRERMSCKHHSRVRISKLWISKLPSWFHFSSRSSPYLVVYESWVGN